MKKLIYFCGLSLVASATLSSCLFEEDNIFDESAALRGQHYTDKITDVLYTPEYGWVMQYFANPGSKGYNIYCRFFENGTTILSSNHEYIDGNKSGKLVSDTSTYVLNEQDGPVLSFNSWNNVLTVFSDPQGDGEGMGGDNEFVVLQVNKDDIIMRGERHDAEVRLLKADRPMDEFIEVIQATDNDVLKSTISEYYLISNNGELTDTIFTYGATDGVLDFTNIQGEDRVDRSLAFISTPTGIRFQSEYSFNFYKINGKDTIFWSNKSHEFSYSDDKNAMVSEDKSITFVPNWVGRIQNRVCSTKNLVSFDQTSGDEQWQQICATLDTAIKGKYKGQSLLAISLGNSSEKGSLMRYGLSFKTTKSNIAAMTASVNVTKETITFDIDKADVSNYLATYQKGGLTKEFDDVADYLNGSWTYTTEDRTFNIHTIKLTNNANSSKVIYLTIE